MRVISDNDLWAEMQVRGAVHGWDNRRRICAEVLRHACARFAIREDADREDIAGRIDRIWVERMSIWGAA